MTLPEGTSARQLAAETQRDGVLIAPGHYFYQSGEDVSSFRLSVSTATDGQIRKGIRILGQAITRQARKRRHSMALTAELPHI